MIYDNLPEYNEIYKPPAYKTNIIKKLFNNNKEKKINLIKNKISIKSNEKILNNNIINIKNFFNILMKHDFQILDKN